MRALKMNMLFKYPDYDNIMGALDMPSGTPAEQTARKNAFMAALTAISGNPLVQPEKDWLWNYLQHCTEKGTGGWGNNKPDGSADLPDVEAASAGW